MILTCNTIVAGRTWMFIASKGRLGHVVQVTGFRVYPVPSSLELFLLAYGGEGFVDHGVPDIMLPS